MKFLLPLLLFFFIAEPAYAYIGPGLGGGVLAVVVGLITSVLLAICVLVWFPLKRLIVNKKSKKSQNPGPNQS